MPPCAPRSIIAFTLGAVLLLTLPLPAAAAPADPAVEKALAYLAGLQGATYPYNAEVAYVVEAIGHIGLDPKRWPSPDAPVFDLMRPYGDNAYNEYKSNTRIALAAASSGYDPRAVHGVDYVAKIRQGFDKGQFGDVTYINDDIWAVIALRASGVAVEDPQIRAAVRNIWTAQAPSGGWSHLAASLGADVDSTGMALVALAMAGENLAGETRAFSFMESMRAGNGGYKPDANAGGTCQSTVWAIHGYSAAARAVPSSALTFLRGLQNADGGLRVSNTGSSSAWCTIEALPILAGAAAPFRSYAPASVTAPRTVGVGDTATLTLHGAWDEVEWDVAGTKASGARTTVAFTTEGTYTYHVVATREGQRARTSGVIDVVSPRPQLTHDPLPLQTLRHTPVSVDASRSTSPESQVSHVEVDWGDGRFVASAGLIASHAFAEPGERVIQVRVRDALDRTSPVATHTLRVINRAPVLDGVPALVYADRGNPVTLDVAATDADGDAPLIHWRFGNATGTGRATLRPTALGPHVIAWEARDPYGGSAQANTTIEVVNLEPIFAEIMIPSRAREGEPVTFEANATDPDGATPHIAWTFGDVVHHGAQGEVTLDAGVHRVQVVATDADGGRRTVTRSIDVQRADAPKSEETLRDPARIEDLAVSLQADSASIRFRVWPPGTPTVVEWRSDVGNGSMADAEEFDIPLPSATWVRVHVRATSAEGEVSVDSGTIRKTPLRLLAPPAISTTGPEVDAGDALALVARVAGTEARFRIDWGDGTATEAGAGERVTHLYDRPGVYAVRVDASAPDGRTSGSTTTIHVRTPESTTLDAPAVIVIAAADGAPGASSETSTAASDAPRRVPAPWGVLAIIMAAWALPRRR